MNQLARIPTIAAALALGTTLAAPARAETRAWAAAKKALPAGLQTVAGLDLSALRASGAAQATLPQLLSKAGAPAAELDAMKTTCGIDLPKAVASVVVGVDAGQKGVAILALDGTSRANLEACVQKLAKAKGQPAAIVASGDTAAYPGLGPSKLYVRWLDKDVIAVATRPDDKALLASLTSGGIGTDAAMSPWLANVNKDAAVWAVVAKSQPIADIHAQMRGAYGTADMKAGTIKAEIHIALDSAKGAADGAAKASRQLAALESSGKAPPALRGVLDSIVVKASGAELVASASASDAVLTQLVGLAAGP
jgi:hypothetical protein